MKRYTLGYSALEKEQIWRFRRAAETRLLSIDYGLGEARFLGSDRDVYHVDRTSCECMDFWKRRRPCKHIYRLLIELGEIDEDEFEGDFDVVHEEEWVVSLDGVERKGCSRAKEKPPMVAAGGGCYPSASPQQETSGLCIASFVLGLVGASICPIGVISLISLILGLIGLRNEVAKKGMRGKFFGRAGVVLSLFGLFLFLVLLIVRD